VQDVGSLDSESLLEPEKAPAPWVHMRPCKFLSLGLAVLLLLVLFCVRVVNMPDQQMATPLQTTLAAPPLAVHFSTTASPATRWITPSPHSCQAVAGEASSCSLSKGPISIGGYRALHVLKAGALKPGWPVGEVEVTDCHTMKLHRQARAYLAETCGNGYSNHAYSAIDVRGKTIRYSVDLRSAGCGCIAAFYLVSMRQNTAPGACEGDFYCDANKVCGQACSEVDIMEANFRMWKTTLHKATDHTGSHSALFGRKYGPGSDCIDTGLPFEVAASVDIEGSQVLVTLSQRGCSAMALVEEPHLGESFRNGMTPVISYWFDPKPGSSRWFDGAMCRWYNPKRDCGASVILSNCSIEDTSVMVNW